MKILYLFNQKWTFFTLKNQNFMNYLILILIMINSIVYFNNNNLTILCKIILIKYKYQIHTYILIFIQNLLLNFPILTKKIKIL